MGGEIAEVWRNRPPGREACLAEQGRTLAVPVPTLNCRACCDTGVMTRELPLCARLQAGPGAAKVEAADGEAPGTPTKTEAEPKKEGE